MSKISKNIGLIIITSAILWVFISSIPQDEEIVVDKNVRYSLQNLDCVQYDPLKNAEKLDKALNNIRRVSGDDYRLVCDYVDYIDISDDAKNPHVLIYNVSSDSTIVLPKKIVDEYESNNLNWLSAIIMHETCHHLQHKLYGGYNGFEIREIERPCVKIQDYFYYKASGNKNYVEMVESIKTDKYGFSISLGPNRMNKIELTGDIKDYCRDVSVEIISKGENLKIQNRGFETIHCAFIDFRVDGFEIPLECNFIEGRSIRNIKLKKPYSKSLNVTATYLGCSNKLVLRNEG